jgi:general secretion pathway protein D
MKKRLIWLTAALAAVGFCAQAEVVITSPTGTPDESDVVLESAVKAVKETPADTVKAVGDVLIYTGDELRNTAHGVASAFKGNTPRETARQDMLADVASSWDRSGEILFRSYKITPAVCKALEAKGTPQGAFLDARGFFNGVDFPEGSSAWFQPEYKQIVVRNTLDNLLQIEAMLGQYHHAELDYKQVEIKAKFIEVSQSTLNQLGFTWSLEDTGGAGTKLLGDLKLNDNQPADVLSAGLRSAAGAFGGNIGAGTMVVTKSGWMPLSLAINALEQAGDSDTLSAPSLTTMDGKAAEIWVGEDRAVPKSFEVKSQDINIHIEHQKWGSELMGVHFSVTPEILKNNLIRLKLNPKVIDMIGYDDYGVSPVANMLPVNAWGLNSTMVVGRYPILDVPAAGITKAWDLMSATLGGGDPNNYKDVAIATGYNTNAFPTSIGLNTSVGFFDSYRNATHEEYGIPLNAVNGRLPYFRVREIKTQVEVADGSTVGLGGLIYDRLETYKDKVPVLGSIPLIGRLFRSEGERSIKRNLMIFVSAGQIANDGQRKSGMALNN